ncbi:MAG: DNA-directed polymerase subunit beta [Paenibacillus sp.]|jgi:hypothetical protein|nr:DNA-directed polymerase subunit beta [Paenibacillus sp.]
MNEKEANVRSNPKVNPAKPKPKRKLRRRWVRMLLHLLRLVIVPCLCVGALGFGLWFGYVYVGGNDSADVWQWSTWKHLYDLVFAN